MTARVIFDGAWHVRGITFLLQAIIFRIVPTALEISMVCGILVRFPYPSQTAAWPELETPQTYKFGMDFAVITVATLAAYTWFTVRTTSWRYACSQAPSHSRPDLSIQGPNSGEMRIKRTTEPRRWPSTLSLISKPSRCRILSRPLELSPVYKPHQ